MDDKYFAEMKEKYRDSLIMYNYYNISEEIENEHFNLNSNYIKFICERSFHGIFSIKIEWNEKEKFCIIVLNYIPSRSHNCNYIEHYLKQIDYKNVLELISIFDKYNRPNKYSCNNTRGLDGSDWKILYKNNDISTELVEWSPHSGLVHDIGTYLIKLVNTDLGPIY